MRRRQALAAFTALLAAAGNAVAQQVLPVPSWSQPVRLRTALFINPRLPPVDPAFIAEVQRRAAAMAVEHLRLEIVFEPGPLLTLAQAFGEVPAATRQWAARSLLPIEGADLTRMAEAMQRGLARSSVAEADLLRFATPHLVGGVRPADLGELATALVSTQNERLSAWRPLLPADEPYHEFHAWVNAAWRMGWTQEVVFTNQLITGLSDTLHSALRGGVTNGVTTRSGAPQGLTSILSLYPFTSNEPAVLALRAGARAESEDAPTWAAALLLHELGHQLHHFGDAFGQEACVMGPPAQLDFRGWVRGLDATSCPIGSSRPMTRGYVRFPLRMPAEAERQAP